jgi:hypothetical protein
MKNKMDKKKNEYIVRCGRLCIKLEHGSRNRHRILDQATEEQDEKALVALLKCFTS